MEAADPVQVSMERKAGRSTGCIGFAPVIGDGSRVTGICQKPLACGGDSRSVSGTRYRIVERAPSHRRRRRQRQYWGFLVACYICERGAEDRRNAGMKLQRLSLPDAYIVFNGGLQSLVPAQCAAS